MGSAFFMPLLIAKLAATVRVFLIVAISGCELISGEGNPGEHFTGIFSTAGSVATFFGGNAVIQNRYDQLCISFQSNDGELSQGDEKPSIFSGEYKGLVKHLGNALGNVNNSVFFTFALAYIKHFGAEHHGIKNFHHPHQFAKCH